MPTPSASGKNRPIAPFVVITIFALAMTIGIALDEPRQVLAQAIRICLSCIGIG